jgi:hypothetical protein
LKSNNKTAENKKTNIKGYCILYAASMFEFGIFHLVILKDQFLAIKLFNKKKLTETQNEYN